METNENFEGLWKDALDRYQTLTGHDLAVQNGTPELQTIGDVQDRIKATDERFETFRHKHEKIFGALRKSLQPLERMMTIAKSGFANSPLGPVGVVFSASVYLVKACGDVSKAYDFVERMLQELTAYTSLLTVHAEDDSIHPILQKNIVEILVDLLMILAQAEKVIKEGRFKRFLSTAFLSHNDELKKLTENLATHIGQEQQTMVHLLYSTSKSINKNIENMTEKTRDMHAKLQDQNSEMSSLLKSSRDADTRRREAEVLGKALSGQVSDKMLAIYKERCGKLARGTGSWLFEEKVFKAWEQHDASIFWVLGPPGVGKSFLSARTIEYLQTKYPPDLEHPSLRSVSYYFFKDNDLNLAQVNVMLKTVCQQITEANAVYRKFAVKTCEPSTNLTSIGVETWANLFQKFFSLPQANGSVAYIIIDGLDEAPQETKEQFFGLLQNVIGAAGAPLQSRVKFAIFARPDVRDVPGFLQLRPNPMKKSKPVEVDAKRNQDDITKYIKTRLRDVSVLEKLRMDKFSRAKGKHLALAKQILKSIQDNADGVFLWVKLVMDQITGKETDKAILETLENAPRELDKMIHHVFERLCKDDNVEIRCLNVILVWVTCAFRPLLLGEIHVIMEAVVKQEYPLLKDLLLGRYSSIFTLTNSWIGNEAEDDEEESTEDGEEDEIEDPYGDLDGDPEQGEDDTEVSEAPEDEPDLAYSPTLPAEDFVEAKIPRDFYTTTVGFSHQRIRDYLENEGSPSTRAFEERLPIGIADLDLAQIEIASTCLKILCSRCTVGYGSLDLQAYANDNFMKHLAKVDMTSVDQDRLNSIGRDLYVLFHDMNAYLEISDDPDSLASRQTFIDNWFLTSEYSRVVQQILALATPEFTAEELEWVNKASLSVKELFKPMAEWCVTKWLIKSGWNDTEYLNKREEEVWALYIYSLLPDTDDRSDLRSSISDIAYLVVPDIPEDEFLRLAEFVPLEKNAHWHACYAWTLMEARHIDSAREHFQTAIDMATDGHPWMPHEGISRCYGEYGTEYEKAIFWMQKAIDSTPSELGITLYLYKWLAKWNLRLGELDKACEAGRITYEATTDYDDTGYITYHVFDGIDLYFTVLDAGSRLQTMLDLIKELWNRRSVDGRSMLTKFIGLGYNIYDQVGKIIDSQIDLKFPSFCQEVVNATLKSCLDKPHLEWSRLQLFHYSAKFLSHYGSIEDEIKFWNALLDYTKDSGIDIPGVQRDWLLVEASIRLSEGYFALAVVALEEDCEVNWAATELAAQSKLESKINQRDLNEEEYKVSYPAMAFGAWRRDYEKMEWRSCFYNAITHAFQMLTDDDPYNDPEGYTLLGKTLLLSGDQKNATIALGLTMQELRPILSSYADQPEEPQSQEPQDAPDSSLPESEVAPLDSEKELEATTSETTGVNGAIITGQHDDSVLVEHTDIHSNHTEDTEERSASHQGDSEYVLLPRGGEEGSDHAPLPVSSENEDDEEEEADDTSESDTTSTMDSDTFDPWECDGPCKESFGEYAELYFCTICYDTCFCDKCVALLRTETGFGPRRKCDKKHTFLQAYPIPEEARVIVADLQNADDRSQKKWLREVKELWPEVFPTTGDSS